MDRVQTHPLPSRDPVTGGPLVITELEGVETGITIRGRFEMPRFARLSPDQSRFLETFLRCRGMLNSVERELGISYPTARARLDAVLRALDLATVREEEVSPPPVETESDDFIEAELDGAATPQDGFPEFDSEAPEAEEPETEPKPSRLEVLGMLERGEVTPERAKTLLGIAR